MQEVEIINIGNKKYAIINEVKEKDTTYIALSNIDDPEDIMIRKSSKEDKDKYIPLEDEDEFFLANLLLFKGTKND